jgi:pyruvate kinase
MSRRAKIVATIGPSSDSPQMLESLINAGLNVARINMSHGTHEGHAKVIKNIREASKKTGYEVAILCDLQGPKIRVDKLKTNLVLTKGEEWVIGSSKAEKEYPQYKECFIPTVYENLVKDAHVGATILFDDGLLEAKAIEKDGDVLKIIVVVGGTLKSNKGINLPDVDISAPSFTDKDREDLIFGLKQSVDYVALSFVRRAEDILEVKYLLHKLKKNTPIISKIEKPEAVENIKEIIKVTDCIMIARGDMGVEVGNHLVPAIQKDIINLCNTEGVPVITATQMLESMTTNARPTRAEANDVANAVWDGTDAVMLSGETASGDYPLEAITMMGQIVEEAEKKPKERPFLRHMDLHDIGSSLQIAASLVAEKTDAKWVLSVTQSGKSCLKMSRFRSAKRILGVTNSIEVMRRMSLYWGITPFYFQEDEEDITKIQDQMIDVLKVKKLVHNGDKIVITHGDGKFFRQGTSNSLRVDIIKDLPREDLEHKKSNKFQEVSIGNNGRILLDTSLCASCQNCVSVCPHGIWTVSKDKSNDTRIDVSKAKSCTVDMECVEQCPTGAIEIINTLR